MQNMDLKNNPFDDYDYDYKYTGEVDQEGKICGEGVAISALNVICYKFTCLGGKVHGICR